MLTDNVEGITKSLLSASLSPTLPSDDGVDDFPSTIGSSIIVSDSLGGSPAAETADVGVDATTTVPADEYHGGAIDNESEDDYHSGTESLTNDASDEEGGANVTDGDDDDDVVFIASGPLVVGDDAAMRACLPRLNLPEFSESHRRHWDSAMAEVEAFFQANAIGNPPREANAAAIASIVANLNAANQEVRQAAAETRDAPLAGLDADVAASLAATIDDAKSASGSDAKGTSVAPSSPPPFELPFGMTIREVVDEVIEAARETAVEAGGMYPIMINVVEQFGPPPTRETVDDHPVFKYGFMANPFVSPSFLLHCFIHMATVRLLLLVLPDIKCSLCRAAPRLGCSTDGTRLHLNYVCCQLTFILKARSRPFGHQGPR